MIRSKNIEICSCDLCNIDDAEEILILRKYSNNQPIHVCKNCGFIYVRERRSSKVIADMWSKDLYGKTYTAKIPAIKIRQLYTIDTIHSWFNLKNKNLCDIGAGEGQMLELAVGPDYRAQVFGIEPSKHNTDLMKKNGIPSFTGSIEEYLKDKSFKNNFFDVVTIVWTLENCFSCLEMLSAAKKLLKNDGFLVVATGSRILVPFKKPLSLYVGTIQSDTHSFRFSRNTLARALAILDFEVVKQNRYIDTDYLVMAGRKNKNIKKNIILPKDNYKEVINFFERWDKEEQHYSIES